MMTSLLLPLLLTTLPAHAWGHHYMVTDQALDRPDAPTGDAVVTVEPLEDFLEAEAEGLAELFDDYYAWLGERGSPRFNPMTFDASEPTRAAFIRAARLNPEARFPLVARKLPGEGAESYGFEVAPEAASPYLHQNLPLITEVEVTVAGSEVPAREVVATFSDEPDWGFDHTLWGYTEYGYGEQPYGKPEGESSKAPFHMQFAHEPFLVRKFVPTVLEGMVGDRVEMFTRLAELAFSTGHDYWGWRFSAWAVHYVQDLAQPYHSKALPSATSAFYYRYVVSPRKEFLTERATQLAANRHFLYEDYVAFGLQESYLGDDALYEALAGYLSWGDNTFASESPMALVDELMAYAADHSLTIDRTLVKAFGPDLTRNAEFDVETDPSYSIVTEMEKMDTKSAQVLLDETGRDFEQAGRATRTILAMTSAAARANADAQ
jgi:hypothetical protein